MRIMGNLCVFLWVSFLVLHVLSGCGGGDSEGAGYIMGSVKNYNTGSALSGVYVSVCNASDLEISNATTNSLGEYSTTHVDAGNGIRLYFTLAGYLTESYSNINMTAGSQIKLETVYMIPDTYAGTGDISGKVINAFDGSFVDGASITFRKGYNATVGTVDGSDTSDSSGSYDLTGLEAGGYTSVVTASGFITSTTFETVLGNTAVTDADIVLCPTIAAGQTRIVLTWGDDPADLDSHLYGPEADGAGTFHVDYTSLSYSYGGDLYAQLDLDDTDQYGPETTTIYIQSNGTYTFKVHDYTNSGYAGSWELATSGAKVRVYNSSGLVATYDVPNAEGTLWTVCTIQGTLVTEDGAMSNSNP